jgi:hypothetical protein
MSSVLSIITIFALIIITIICLDTVLVYADDTSELRYCAKGEAKDGISIKICSVDKEKCDKNAKENEISASCNEIN